MVGANQYVSGTFPHAPTIVPKWVINAVSVGTGGDTSIGATLECDIIRSLIGRMSWIAIAEKGGNGT